jgi:hypothetical protein
MNTDLLFRQIRELKRTLGGLEIAMSEINNAIFMIEERMYDLEEEEHEHRQIVNWR